MLFLPGFIIPEAPEDLTSFSFILYLSLISKRNLVTQLSIEIIFSFPPKPSKIISAIGALKLNTQSTNPTLTGSTVHITAEIPLNTACIKYSPGAKNIKANSNGSVTPVKNAEIDPASNNPYTTFFLILLFTMIHC